jgi:fengycin family lipopeptide synthetase D
MHHIISDGWSIEQLKQEFTFLYNAYKRGIPGELKPLEIQYKDYSAWQNRLLADEEKMSGAKAFWKLYLGGIIPHLNLPYDYTNHPHNSASSAYRWVLPESLTNRLRKMAADSHASLFMILLAGLNILLYQITNQVDIIMATPAAARQHEALKSVVGLFVNTLILRTKISKETPFIDFFKHFRENVMNMLEYQSIPLELICNELKIKYPRFPVFFNMVNTRQTQQQTLVDFESRHLENVQDAKSEITCYVTEYKNVIEINCHYFRHRFKPTTIEGLMDLYKKALVGICDAPGKKLQEFRFTRKKKKLKRYG